jgi:hypothetical protein
MPRGPRLSRGRAARWFGVASASNIQQARGVHYQARYQPDMECYACDRIGTRQFRVAQIIFAGRDLGNRIICAQQRGMLSTHAIRADRSDFRTRAPRRLGQSGPGAVQRVRTPKSFRTTGFKLCVQHPYSSCLTGLILIELVNRYRCFLTGSWFVLTVLISSRTGGWQRGWQQRHGSIRMESGMASQLGDVLSGRIQSTPHSASRATRAVVRYSDGGKPRPRRT